MAGTFLSGGNTAVSKTKSLLSWNLLSRVIGRETTDKYIYNVSWHGKCNENKKQRSERIYGL